MTTQIVLPKLGNSVESSLIVAWLKQPGDAVAEGDALCTVETDKTTVEVTSTASGVLLQQLVNPGDDVPVLAPIAVIGDVGDAAASAPSSAVAEPAISPRARNLAHDNHIDTSKIAGSGPGGRIIERDVKAAMDAAPIAPTAPVLVDVAASDQRFTPVAKAMFDAGGYIAPERGSGPGGRVTKQDLKPTTPTQAPSAQQPAPAQISSTGGAGTVVPLTGVRKVIAERMRASLAGSAQLTMNASADARALLALRKRLKASDEALGLRDVTINDLVLFAVARTLPTFPELNATFADGVLTQFADVHLGFAVDTPRGLLVPVVRNAATLSLKQLADATGALSQAAQTGKIAPDQLSGGTFTVTNLGSFGVESFTPILNTPQVGILGVGNVNLKAVEVDGQVAHVPHIGLSLTIDHQIVDGAPGAKFLQKLARNIAQIDLMLAL